MRANASISILLFGALAGPTFSQAQASGSALMPSESTRLVVGGDGVETVRETGFTPATSALTLPSPGALWRRTDEGQGWVGRVVAIADNGTQVFTSYDTGSDRAELLSSFASMPVMPLWNDPVPTQGVDVAVDSSESTDVFVTCRRIPTGSSGSDPKRIIVDKYTSSSAAPDWTFQFPSPTHFQSDVAISRDGRVILAGMLNSSTSMLEVRVFEPGSGTPVRSYTQPLGTSMRAMLLSKDGSTAYFASGTSCYLWDVASGNVIAQYSLPTALDSHAISGDGSVFAFGGFNVVKIFQRQASGTYLLIHTQTNVAQTYCGRVEISEDASTVAWGWNHWDANLAVTLQMLDVPTRTVTMSDTVIGLGTYQNVVSDLSLSGDGSRLAAALWGDQAGLAHELRFYRKYASLPTATFNFAGSVFDVDMSLDGRRVAVAAKAVHANVYAGGGEISLYSFEPEDFAVMGNPQLGRKVRFGLWGAPFTPSLLLKAPAAATIPFVFPTYGTLYLQRSTMVAIPMPNTNSGGYSEIEYQLSSNPAAIGTTLYFQGCQVAPRRLTGSWSQVTIVP